MKTSKEIRNTFLEFFRSQQHGIVPSAPIVVKDDPTLMFTNAGMNQFKDNFLGTKAPLAPRLADTQKCLRVSGKHNDLEEVGHDTYHHTMFEMLGNWSFGDYYKKEAIEWAWKLLVDEFGINPEHIYVTVFGGDEGLGLGLDEEAKEEWRKWTSEDRILACGKKDNFWEMGDVGPCGPCSEIHVDLRTEEEKAQIPGKSLVNEDHPEVIEVWNLVFMEYNRKADGSLHALPAKNVDTGMGFERLCMVLQGKRSNYDTDLFAPYIEFMEKELGCKYNRSEEETIAMRVVMDHLRAVAFTISDGQLPSNTGAGYVIRRILRRASRYGFQFLGQTEPFLYRMVDILADIYSDIFPDLSKQAEFIRTTIEQEERSFLRTLARGTQLFDNYLREHKAADTTIDGQFAFTLYDTFGFPIDLTELMAREQGWTVDLDGFKRHMDEQKRRSRAATDVKAGDWIVVAEMEGLPEFTGYEMERDTVRIMRHRTSKTKKKDIYQVVLDKTPFYAESGGQVGDTGWLVKGEERIRVVDTKKENELIVHFVNKLPEDATGHWDAQVDSDRRRLIKANHSATHLLHAALRQVLGTHVEQRGSLVNEKGLRFDFSHPQKVTPEEIAQVEEIVNAKIAEGIALDEHRGVPIAEAKEMGAMALFGEKYGDEVRVIVFDPGYSVELCGGIHVANTSDIRLFKLVSEGSVAAGVRRVEALSSDLALNFLDSKLETLEEVSALLKHPKDVTKAVGDLIDKYKNLEKEMQKLQASMVGGMKDKLMGEVKEINGVRLLAAVVEVPSANELKSLTFDLLKGIGEGMVVLGAAFGEKANLNVGLSQGLVDGGELHAGKLVKEIAREIGGGGGGQPHFASAGGKNPGGLSKAMEKAASLLG